MIGATMRRRGDDDDATTTRGWVDNQVDNGAGNQCSRGHLVQAPSAGIQCRHPVQAPCEGTQ